MSLLPKKNSLVKSAVEVNKGPGHYLRKYGIIKITRSLMLQMSHLDQNEIVEVKRKFNVYMSHIENWNTDTEIIKCEVIVGTAPLQATVRATGMFVCVSFQCPPLLFTWFFLFLCSLWYDEYCVQIKYQKYSCALF